MEVKKVNGRNQRLLSVTEAAEYLNIHPMTIRDLGWKRVLPLVRIGKRTLLDVKDLDAYIERCKVKDNN